MAKASLYLHQRRERTQISRPLALTLRKTLLGNEFMCSLYVNVSLCLCVCSDTTMMCSMAKNFFCHFIHQLAPDRTMFRLEFHLLDAHFRKVKHCALSLSFSIILAHSFSLSLWHCTFHQKNHQFRKEIERRTILNVRASTNRMLAGRLNVLFGSELVGWLVQVRCVSLKL